ncbi:MAG: tRNA (guanosine(37)-N1)-methyltransferase TrmD [Lachnospiraceae bacterium]|nr:tRNA (guanosine(37)-N1)-methyltransferase TrmD [Lachnospiraceae bacterium]
MNFYVMTLFPEMIEQGMNTSITGRAIAKGLISLETVNIRDYSVTGNGRIDDYPYGGGAGMVMQAEPVCRAYEALAERISQRQKPRMETEPEASERPMTEQSMDQFPLQTPGDTEAANGIQTDDSGSISQKVRVIYLTPQGRVFHQEMAQEFAQEENLIFLCGHYEGVDERVLDTIVTDQVSIGDYVLTGGELPAMVMMDAISRMVPGVLSNAESGQSESFSDHLLEYPQYSRPEIWRGQPVPPVLLSGHHGNVDRWRRDQSLMRTLKSRPDLLDDVILDKADRKFLRKVLEGDTEYELTDAQRTLVEALL